MTHQLTRLFFGVVIFHAVSHTLAQPQTPTAPATHPSQSIPEGEKQVDQRLAFLTIQLSSVETSLTAIDKALRLNGYKVGVKQDDAERYRMGNELMDRKGGAPVRWDEFYGKTARQFHGTGGQRPQQFDYIYRANTENQKRADREAAAIGNNIQKLLERRRQLEAEQSALWCKIGFHALTSRELLSKPLYRFSLKINGADSVAAEHLAATNALVDFLITIVGLGDQMIKQTDADQSLAFHCLQESVVSARTKLSDRLGALAPLAEEIANKDTALAKAVAGAKALADVATNIGDAHRLALDGDRANDDQRKNTFRGVLQEAILNYAEAAVRMDEYVTGIAKQWNAACETTIAAGRMPAVAAAPSNAAPPPPSLTPVQRVVGSSGARELLNTMEGYTGRKVGEAVVIKSDESIASAETFKPPVAFKITAQTDSTNIRIGFAADQIIFNWERDRGELRVDGGPASERHKKGAGSIPVNQWVEISITVLPKLMIICVDGVERYRTAADFSKVNQKLSIREGADSVVKVKSVIVSTPSESPPAGVDETPAPKPKKGKHH